MSLWGLLDYWTTGLLNYWSVGVLDETAGLLALVSAQVRNNCPLSSKPRPRMKHST